jgi:hypothetical protein
MARETYPGLFSTVTFVPDEFRAEGVNLGVVVLCPQLRQIQMKLADDFQRARRLVSSTHSFDSRRLKVMVDGLKEQINENQAKILSAAEFRHFTARFRNKLQFTEPRACVVSDLTKDTRDLFTRLVTDEHHQRAVLKGKTVQQLRADFRRRLQGRGLYDRLEHDIKIPARYKPGEYEFGHGYRNGKYHVIHEEGLAVSDPDDNSSRAFALVTEIQDAQSQWRDASFTVIASFAPDQLDVRRTVRSLFRDKEIELRDAEEMDEVIQRISNDLAAHQ